ncbi:MAG: pilus assembly protein N-terminal domain-containing protein [Myxococcaceae bacterium]|jgi:pilus assembly protein CpaC|nr:pilus assembly protein N-terminal domain-containing protein [Myxococcaceae bacterium]MCA3012860.1 pilus assembly protein N-terminal domain-containing protein [Myxococcaceae bacterium]
MVTVLLLSVALCAEPIRLVPGTQLVLKVPGVNRVAVGQESVADVRPTGRGELLITANGQGRTSLTLWTTNGMQTRTIVVDDGKASELGRMVKTLVNPALRVDTFNGLTVIDGKLDSVEELRRLNELVGSDPTVRVLASVDPRVMPAVADTISAAFRRQGLVNARAIAYGSKIVLEGSVADERELQKALMIANSYAQSVTPAFAP